MKEQSKRAALSKEYLVLLKICIGSGVDNYGQARLTKQFFKPYLCWIRHHTATKSAQLYRKSHNIQFSVYLLRLASLYLFV